MRSSFLLQALLCAIPICAAPAPAPAPKPYVATSYVELSLYTIKAFTEPYTTLPGSVVIYTKAVLPTATPALDAISTSTDSETYAHLTVVEVVLPPGSGRTSTYNYDDTISYTTPTRTSYLVPVTYTPHASCTSQNWTFVTNLPVTIPYIVQSLITPATVSTSVSSYTGYSNDKIWRTTDIVAVLNPTDAAAADVLSASSYGEPYGLGYCYTPTTHCVTYTAVPTCTPSFVSVSSYLNSYNNPSPYGSCNSNACFYRDIILLAVCIPVGWIVLWLLIGLWESWMSFKGLMLGKQRKRGMPYSWCCINWLFLCWVGPTYKAKSAEEQAALKETWKERKAVEKFKLWMKWGFRWKYPDMIGTEPEKDKRAFRQRCL